MDQMIDIHADDYGLTINTSKDMLECMRAGALDSFSIIPNMSCFDECMTMLYKEIPNLPFLPKIAVHLNLVEGKSLSFSTLISRNGLMCLSWGDIFIASFSGLKKDLKTQLKQEIKEQIIKIDEAVSKCIEIAQENGISYSQKGIRIDSHTHTHSIPLVFNALKEVIEEEKLNIEYIRNPKEPLWPFIQTTNLWSSFKIINFVKNVILNIFSWNIDRYDDIQKIKKEYMWGLVMSGKMDIERIKVLYPKMLKVSKNKKRNLELLFHPGMAIESEDISELNIDNYKNFNSAENRHIEKEAVLSIKKLIEEI